MDRHQAKNVFGSLIAKKLRDAGIKDAEFLLAGRWKTPSLRGLQSELSALDPQQRDLVRRVVVHVMTSATHDFLFSLQEAADDEAVRILVGDVDVAKASDGLHGEIFGPDGWFAQFSDYGEPVEDA